MEKSRPTVRTKFLAEEDGVTLKIFPNAQQSHLQTQDLGADPWSGRLAKDLWYFQLVCVTVKCKQLLCFW